MNALLAAQSDNVSVLLVVAITGVILILVFLFNRRLARLDRLDVQKLEAAAKAAGFTFREKATAGDMALIDQSQLFKAVHKPCLKHIVEAPATGDGAVTVFDFSYLSGRTKGARTISQTVARVQWAGRELPQFLLKPESVASKVGLSVDGSDISFSNSPQFNQLYVLRGLNEAAIREVFTDAVIRDRERHPKFCLEGAGNALLIYEHAHKVPPEELRAFVDDAKRIAALFRPEPTVSV